MPVTGHDSLKTRRTLTVDGKSYDYFSLDAAAQAAGLGDISRLPFSLKVLLENLLRLRGRPHRHGRRHQGARAPGSKTKTSDREIAFRPARVLMQDFTGVPAVVDLAAMREAMVDLGGDPKKINPLSPVDLVIDHSVRSTISATPQAFARNVEARVSSATASAISFLRWGQEAFDNFRVVPPGTGICHQVNLEYLAQVGVDAPTKAARRDRLSRHAGRHRQPHDDGQRPRACSAGASAASRPRRRCSASRSRC